MEESGINKRAPVLADALMFTGVSVWYEAVSVPASPL